MSDDVAQQLKQQFFNGMSHATCTVNIVNTGGAAGRALVTRSLIATIESMPMVIASKKNKALSVSAEYFANLCRKRLTPHT